LPVDTGEYNGEKRVCEEDKRRIRKLGCMEICGRMTLSASLLVLLLGLELLLPQAMAQDPERDAYARRMTSQVLESRDRNRNGRLDPDEIKRTSQGKVDGDQNGDGILTKAEIYRRYYNRAAVRPSGSQASAVNPVDTEWLVPGFGVEEEIIPVRGFGPAAELEAGGINRSSSSGSSSRRTSPADAAKQEAEAKRLISFYTALDTNKNQRIEPSEIAASRYRDLVTKRIREAGMDPSRPIDYTKFIKKRLSNAGVSSSNAKKVLSRSSSKSKERSTRSRSAASRTSRGKVRELDVPDWIQEKDSNGDRQVSLVEFAARLTDREVEKFRGWDLNDDGFVTIAEYLRSEDD